MQGQNLKLSSFFVFKLINTPLSPSDCKWVELGNYLIVNTHTQIHVHGHTLWVRSILVCLACVTPEAICVPAAPSG